jgi:flagellar biosynthetic protein FliP
MSARRSSIALLIVLVAFVIGALPAFAQSTEGTSAPDLSFELGGDLLNAGNTATGVKIALLMTALSLVPSLIVMMTSFTRIVVVFSFLRQAMSTPNVPPNQVLLALALFLTVFVMMPVWTRINDTAIQPLVNGEITEREAWDAGVGPIRTFMFSQTREKDLELFLRASHHDRPDGPEDVPLSVLIPSFMLSELKTAFQIGFILYVPFLIVDLVVASVLMSMGMMMLPPAMISLPFKVLLFVLVDGWHLIVRSLLDSFG